MRSVSSRRYLSLWLRRLATDRVARHSLRPIDRPLALIGPAKNAKVLIAINDAAMLAGLREGMSFADACAIHPGLDWAEAAPEKDACLIEKIGEWCERYTPLVGVDQPDGLFLDITGVAHLFGGEAALARDLVNVWQHRACGRISELPIPWVRPGRSLATERRRSLFPAKSTRRWHLFRLPPCAFRRRQETTFSSLV